METETKREIISPEGVEERLVYEIGFRVTLTGGGKFRTYVIPESGKIDSHGRSHNTKEEALKELGMTMAMFGGMHIDADKTIDILLKGLKS